MNRDSSGRKEFWIDGPSEPSIPGEKIIAFGWALKASGAKIHSVRAIAEGRAFPGEYGFERPDVAAEFAGRPDSLRSGFNIELTLSAGVHDVWLQVSDENGTWEILGSFVHEVRQRAGAIVNPASEESEADRYQRWLKTNRLTPYLLRQMTRDAQRIAVTGPRLSILVSIDKISSEQLDGLVACLRQQLYPKWELVLARSAPHETQFNSLLAAASTTDSRIRIQHGDEVHLNAHNLALFAATGDYVGLLQQDDRLTPDALLHLAEAILAEPSSELLYTDKDKLLGEGRADPSFKGAFSPEMALSVNDISPFAVVSRRVANEIAGFRGDFGGAAELDFYLRVLERIAPERVLHLPFVCYHERAEAEGRTDESAPNAELRENPRRCIAESLGRRGIQATPFISDFAAAGNSCVYQLGWSPQLLRENPVTIVIPTKNRGDLLQRCVASLVRTVDRSCINLIVVDHHSDEEATQRYLEELADGKILNCKVVRPQVNQAVFNFSRLINEGVAQAATELVLLLNNDTEALEPRWLEDMVGWMSIGGVGAVGATLLYPDSTIQHAGIVVGSHEGLPEHLFHRLNKDEVGYGCLPHLARNVSAVTGACLLTSKTTWRKVGGFDEKAFPVDYNDVDYCLRLAQLGKRIVCTPQAVLLHHGGLSRDASFRPHEHTNFLIRYPSYKDPFYNENLDSNGHPQGKVNPRNFVHAGRVNKLKVLALTADLECDDFGASLLERLSYFAGTGYDITVASPRSGPGGKQYEAAGVTVAILDQALSETGDDEVSYKERLSEIGQRLSAGSFDLVICNTFRCFWGVSLAAMLRLPVIWHIGENITAEQAMSSAQPACRLAKNDLRTADRVTFESNAARHLCDPNGAQENFEIIRGSVNVKAIDSFCAENDPIFLKRKHAIDSGHPVVSMIGPIASENGQRLFIEAVSGLLAQYRDIPAVSFLIVGNGELEYLNFLHAKVTPKMKHFRILADPSRSYDYFRLTDVFVCPNLPTAAPRVLLEAMSFGLGIICQKTKGIEEIVGDSDEGVIVPRDDVSALAERIRILVQNPALRRQLGLNAQAKATRLFNSEMQLQKHLQLTKEVVARHY